MKFIHKIREFILAVRWYMHNGRGDSLKCVNVYPDYHDKFIEQHKSEYAEFENGLILNEIKESFDYFNRHFREGEVSIIIRSINEHEGLYRVCNSNTWFSHGGMSYVPYFYKNEECLRWLGLYFYLICLGMDDIDFYPSNIGFVDKQFTAESMRNEPCYLELVDGKYSVSSDMKVTIKC